MPRITPKSTVAASRAKAATQPKKPKAKTVETKAATGWKTKTVGRTVGGRGSEGRSVGGQGSSGRTVGGRGSEGRSVGGRGSDRPSIRPGISVGGGSSSSNAGYDTGGRRS